MADRRPNIVFVMADDHAAHAIGAHGSAINATPGIDRLAHERMRFATCFSTNSICSPSRATILAMVHHKAPHRAGEPAPRHADLYAEAPDADPRAKES